MPADRFDRGLNVTEASVVTGLSVSTLNKRRLTGGGPIFRKLGRRVVYLPEDLAKWLDQHRRLSTSGGTIRAA